jgi:6-phosphogluconolactonase (cycloisomerase 2 family)
MFSTSASLTPIANAVAAGTTPFALAVDPSGSFVYVANVNSSTVSIYTIDPLSGKLIPNTQAASIATGAGPVAVATDPSGKFVYVVDQFASDISIYAINPDGSLTHTGNATAGNAPKAIAVVGGIQ